jgi:amidase
VADLLRFDATQLAAMIQAREVSAVELTEACIARIEALNPRINALVTPLFDQAVQTASECDAILAAGGRVGPLHGVPVVIKDLFDFKAGVRSTLGCRAFLDFIPNETSAHVARLEAAGAVVLGKTNTPEFGHKGITDNRVFGPTSNPFDLTRNAGGSSGGSAAAVACGMAPLGQGSDAGGSVRIPAAWCGIVGFKPTFGRIPNTGGRNAFGAHTPFVQVGALARTVRDAALLTQTMAGPHPHDPFSLPSEAQPLVNAATRSKRELKVAFSPALGVFALEEGILDTCRQAVMALSEAGLIVEEVPFSLPCSQETLAWLWRRQVGVVYAEFFASLEAAGRPVDIYDPTIVPIEVCEMTRYGRSATALETRTDLWTRTEILYAVEEIFNTYDLLVTPTVSCWPVKNSTDGCTRGPATVDGQPVEPCIGWCLTHPFNFTGHPAASVPAGQSPLGLPAGLQIIGRRFEDASVLAACMVLEERRPWLKDLDRACRAL